MYQNKFSLKIWAPYALVILLVISIGFIALDHLAIHAASHPFLRLRSRAEPRLSIPLGFPGAS